MGPHRGPPKGWSPLGDKKKLGSILEGVFEIKKLFLGEDIRPKDIKLGPHRGSPNG